MEDLSRDPIIAFYAKMSRSTEYETKLPIFSETILRLAMTQILGKFRNLEPCEIEMYRKLLLFYYSERYESVEDLLEIMQCFNEDDQNECFGDYHNIIHEWIEFSRTRLNAYLYKEAFNELLYEWVRRYCQVFGQVTKELLHMKAIEVQQFLWPNDKVLKFWLRNFESTLPGRQFSDTVELQPMTADDLKISKIFADLKSKVNPMVFEEVSNKPPYVEQDMGPPKKKIRKERLELLDIQIIKEGVEFDEAVQEVVEELEDNNLQHDVLVKGSSVDDNEEQNIEQHDDDKLLLADIVDSEDSRNPTEDPEVNPAKAEITAFSRIITHDMALKYLSELQAYAVVNGYSNAFGLLDEVDTIFRANC